MQEGYISHTYNAIKDTSLAFYLSASILLANLIDKNSMVVYANDPLSRQAKLALPSALPAPEVTANPNVDLGLQVGTSVISLELARRTSSVRCLGAMALSAQILSCSVDAAVERTGWLTAAERAQQDVGFSAISVAWVTKFLLDNSERADSVLKRRLLNIATATFAGAMTVGSYLVEGSNGGKLDMTAHAAGIAVGLAAYTMNKRKKNNNIGLNQYYNET